MYDILFIGSLKTTASYYPQDALIKSAGAGAALNLIKTDVE
jgi:hypothetical protein